MFQMQVTWILSMGFCFPLVCCLVGVGANFQVNAEGNVPLLHCTERCSKKPPQLFCDLLKAFFFFSVKCYNCGPMACCNSIPANSSEMGDLLLLASDKSSAVHSSPGISRFGLCPSQGHAHWVISSSAFEGKGTLRPVIALWLCREPV